MPFYADNMFPGDSVTQYYCVQVSHSDNVTLRFHASIPSGYEKLSEVLRCRVKVGGTTLYEGLMRDMPMSVNYRLSTQRRVTRNVVYEITAYLDTSVGDPYQNQELLAGFSWWIEETGALASPPTGDTSHIYLWAAVAALTLIALVALLVVLYRRDRRLAQLLITLILLTLALSTLFITTFAANWAGVSVKRNYFKTGTVDINLNDGKPVMDLDQKEMYKRLEPGMTVEEKFFIQNQSTDAVYYKLYFKNVDGKLADVLRVSIYDGNRAIYSGIPMSQFTRIGAGRPVEKLELGQKKTLTLRLYFPTDAGNEYQEQTLTFVLCADAVQTKNNSAQYFPEKIPTP